MVVMAPDPYRVCIVCSGNICRSPMAEVVLRELVAREGLSEAIEVDSAGTGDWHIGEQADHRALAALTQGGYDGSAHRARQFDPHWFAVRDLVVALDRGHLRALRSWAPNERDRAKVRLLRSFDPELADRPDVDLDLDDPYDHGAEVFAETLRHVESACHGLLQHIRRELDARAGGAGARAGTGRSDGGTAAVPARG